MDKARDKIIRNMLAERGVGAVLLWRPEELVMATGYLPLWGASVCLYPATGDPVIYIPELEPTDLLPSGFRYKTFPWGNIECPDPWEILYKSIEADLVESGIDDKSISFVEASCRSSLPVISAEWIPMPLNFTTKLKRLAKGGYAAITDDILRLFLYKTTSEIAHITLANKIGQIGIQTFYDNLIQGKTEAEVACAVETAVHSQTGKEAIKYAKAWAYIMSGINSSYGGRYARSSGKKLVNGDLVMIEMAVCVNGYWCDITRTGRVAHVSALQQKIYDVVKEAHLLALDLIKPGVEAKMVDSKVRAFISQKGYGAYFTHALGHHVGFRYHDPGQGFSPDSNLTLSQGMVLTVEPGIYIPEHHAGVRIENNILITSDGYKILSDYSIEIDGK
ncbi:MAG: Xaa-Pro peptidase family protein [Tannerella sp.]|nr:Xaa-Pro peptidase family protein [Tannerella sp.]